AFQCPHAKQSHVAGFSKHHFIVCFINLGTENSVADLSLNPSLSGGSKDSLPSRCNTDRPQHVRGKPREFRTRVNQRRQRLGSQFLALRIASDDVDLECAHGCKDSRRALVRARCAETALTCVCAIGVDGSGGEQESNGAWR